MFALSCIDEVVAIQSRCCDAFSVRQCKNEKRAATCLTDADANASADADSDAEADADAVGLTARQ